MEKLYKLTYNLCFVSSKASEQEVLEEAEFHLNEQYKISNKIYEFGYGLNSSSISEILKSSDIPENCKNSIPRGSLHLDLTADQVFEKLQKAKEISEKEEKELYLKLKAKFENEKTI